MTRWWPLMLALGACAGFDERGRALPKLAQLRGELGGPPGDAWLFLCPPGEGFPLSPAPPEYASAATAARRASGDGSYVFSGLEPNPYRLWAFVDSNGNFDPQVDVLAQPGAGDRVSPGFELNLQPGQTRTLDLTAGEPVEREPPAFRLEGAGAEVVLDEQPGAPVAVTLLADTAGGRLDATRVGFAIGLVDADHDGRPDDADGDSVPDLSLRLLLRLVPRPGQVPDGASLVVPVILNPAPFLAALGGSLTAQIVVGRLQGYLVPQAQLVVAAAGKPAVTTPLGQPPAGEYELVALTAGGQFWRMPNALASRLPEQGVRFHFVRAAP